MKTVSDVLQEIVEVVGEKELKAGLVAMAIPDIHGQPALARIAADFAIRSPGRTIWLGDAIDKGPSSCAVVDILCDVQDRRPDNIWTCGNHEMMARDSLEDGKMPLDIPPDEDLDKYAIVEWGRKYGGIPKRHLEWLDSLKPYHEGKHVLYVHGGMDDPAWIDVPPSQIPPTILMWSYGVHPKYKGKIVRGHMPTGGVPLETHNSIDLETEFRHSDPSALHIGIIDDRPAKTHRLLGYVRIDYRTLGLELVWNPQADFRKGVQL